MLAQVSRSSGPEFAIGHTPFLRVPPFPGAKISSLECGSGKAAVSCEPADLCLEELIRNARVGGTFWAAQPELPSRFLLVRSVEALLAHPGLAAESQPVLWDVHRPTAEPPQHIVVTGECDPWHMLSGAAAVILEPDDELRIIAAILGIPAYVHDRQRGQVDRDRAATADLLGAALSRGAVNPFTGVSMSAPETVELCSFWRRLIDSNRDLGGGLGFALWKQAHVAPLLWGGSEPFRFIRNARDIKADAPVAVWRAKASSEALDSLEISGVPCVEIEDGFLRSRGLGADCVPPLSITVDWLGAYFDPACPSKLEQILEEGPFDDALLDRAARLRQVIVEAGLGKYAAGASPALKRRVLDRRHILVPGQVEDDRAVQLGGCGLTSNLELLARVRAQAPDAYIIYKPHPDVLAGHRRGAVAHRDAVQYADEISAGCSIFSLIDLVDEVHVNTSLTGFEAILRGSDVTTYGVPFYAGWGLTHDLGPVPARRTARRTVDELVAAALLLYPRYLDPHSGLPCPAEIVVGTLTSDVPTKDGFLVKVRRLQGRLKRGLRSLAE